MLAVKTGQSSSDHIVGTTMYNNQLVFALACVTLLSQTAACFQRCPYGNPFAYLEGSYCCLHSVEAYRPNIGDVPPCDGGPLELNSRCCRDDEYVPCPHGENACRSFVRETCYLDGEKVTKYPNDRKNSKDLCMSLTESDLDPEAEALWVREYLDGEEWQFSGRCSRVGREEEVCKFRRKLPAVADDADDQTATAGVSRALSLTPPGKRCEFPRKWKTIRGKLKCRRPRTG